MPTKLHINLRQGVIEVDGEPDFVEKVYKDFKGEVLKRLASHEPDGGDDGDEIEADKSAGAKIKKGTSEKKAAGKRATGKRAKGAQSCGVRILELKKKKAFAKDGLFADAVRAKLKEDGHTYGSNLVGATLTALYKRGELRRTDKDGKWLYLNP